MGPGNGKMLAEVIMFGKIMDFVPTKMKNFCFSILLTTHPVLFTLAVFVNVLFMEEKPFNFL